MRLLNMHSLTFIEFIIKFAWFNLTCVLPYVLFILVIQVLNLIYVKR
jgi:uncharacterized membrane protein YhdT